jgi:hypothetical protein
VGASLSQVLEAGLAVSGAKSLAGSVSAESASSRGEEEVDRMARS